MGTAHSRAELESCAPASTTPLTEVIYTPDARRHQGWHIWANMFNDLLSSRDLIWRLIVRDISSRYRQSVLGYVWAILPAMATAMIFAFLKTSGTIPLRDTPIPYAAYALWGVSIWQLFAGCLISATGSLAAAGSLVSKIRFPKDSLVIASMGAPIFDFFIRLPLVALVFVWSGVAMKWQVIFAPLAIIPMILLCLGFGFVLSIANLAFRDIANALGIILTLGMFVTPVLYPPSFEWPYVLITFINPVSPLLIASHGLIADGTFTMPDAFVFSAMTCLLTCLVGWRFFYLALPRIIQLS